jgi:hypothetical protein
MSRGTHLLLTAALFFTIVAFAAYLIAGARPARGDVGGVYSNVPWFLPNQIVTITVSAEDDDGTLTIESDLDGSKLTVTNCTGIGSMKSGECDGSGKDAVSGQGTDRVRVRTNDLDTDDTAELLTVTLTLIANCDEEVKVTVSGDQPGNVGPDDVTINCEPPTPTPTSPPTSTPLPPTATPQPPAAPVSTPVAEVISQVIQPPNTGSAGLR